MFPYQGLHYTTEDFLLIFLFEKTTFEEYEKPIYFATNRDFVINKILLKYIFSTCNRLANVVAHHDKLLTQWSSEGIKYSNQEYTRVGYFLEIAGYGNTGCRVFKRGIQNWKDFCLKIYIPKVNFENWLNGEMSKSAKIWLSKPIFYVKSHRNLSWFFFIEEYQFRSIFFVIGIFW